MSPVIREARFADCEPICALMSGYGFFIDGAPADHWAGLWQENPAMPEDQSLPIGWVLEKAGNIVGHLGNIPLHYHYQGRRLLAGAAHAFVVDAGYRGHSLRLTAAFFSQKNVDLLLSTTANVSAGAAYQVCKAERIPQANYDKALFWMVNARGFASAFLHKRGYGAVFGPIGAAMLAPVLRMEAWLRQRAPRRGTAALETSVQEARGIDEEFNEFWQRTLAERPQCLLAERSLAALRWHFGHRGAGARQAKFVCARRASRLVGYAVLTREDSDAIGLRRTRVADLIVENDDPDLIDALLCAAVGQARRDGSHVLEMVGLPPRIRARLTAGKAYTRQLASWPFWYKAVSPGLREVLRDENVWYGSSYDGDASL